MKVLSLFDGISTGYLALKKAGIKIDKYYASEVDIFATAVSKYHHKDKIIYLGDVRDIKKEDVGEIDLLIGGSPCQSFSFSGKRNGATTKDNVDILTLEQYLYYKENKFEFEGYSYLFWEFVRLLKEVKPKYFFLENVMMSPKWKNVITNVLGVKPVLINSADFSAQNRKRLYWTNIDFFCFGKRNNDVIKDILVSNPEEKFFNNKPPEILYKNKRSGVIGYAGGKQYKQARRIFSKDVKAPTITTEGKQPRVLDKDSEGKIRVRQLTSIEYERLQTLSDNYTKWGLFEDGSVKEISKTQRYKMIANGWTLDVVACIFSFLKKQKQGN